MFTRETDLTLTDMFSSDGGDINLRDVLRDFLRLSSIHDTENVQIDYYESYINIFIEDEDELIAHETFGYGIYCDCCGTKLNPLNKGKYSLCEKCEHTTLDKIENFIIQDNLQEEEIHNEKIYL